MTKTKKPRWKIPRLIQEARRWLQRTKKKKSPVSEQSSWWDFLWRFPNKQEAWVEEFVNGSYVFSPMRTYQIGTENIVMWEYRDRMMLSLLLAIIRPLFKHVISKLSSSR